MGKVMFFAFLTIYTNYEMNAQNIEIWANQQSWWGSQSAVESKELTSELEFYILCNGQSCKWAIDIHNMYLYL